MAKFIYVPMEPTYTFPPTEFEKPTREKAREKVDELLLKGWGEGTLHELAWSVSVKSGPPRPIKTMLPSHLEDLDSLEGDPQLVRLIWPDSH